MEQSITCAGRASVKRKGGEGTPYATLKIAMPKGSSVGTLTRCINIRDRVLAPFASLAADAHPPLRLQAGGQVVPRAHHVLRQATDPVRAAADGA